MSKYFVTKDGRIVSRLSGDWLDVETHKSVWSIIEEDLTEVSKAETEYLRHITKPMRMVQVKNRTFSKLSKLGPGDHCIVTVANGPQWATINRRYDAAGGMMFQVEVEDGKKSRLRVGAEKVEKFEESMADFYIVMSGSKPPPGTILMKYFDHTFALSDHKFVTFDDKKFKKISSTAEARALSKYDIKERVKIRDCVSRKCYWRYKRDKESLTITGKNVAAGDIRISLRDKRNQEVHDISISEIQFDKPKLHSLGGRANDKGATQNSLKTSTSSLEERFVVCPKTNLLLVNPRSVKSASDGVVDDSGTELCLRVGEHGVVPAQLRWRGIVDGTECIGCVLNQDTEHGMDGTINDRGLFECDIKDRGVLIPVANEVVQSCATSTFVDCADLMHVPDQARHAEWRMKSPSIDPACICCVRKIEYPRHGERRDRLIVEDGGSLCVRDVVFRGFINGVECAGVNV